MSKPQGNDFSADLYLLYYCPRRNFDLQNKPPLIVLVASASNATKFGSAIDFRSVIVKNCPLRWHRTEHFAEFDMELWKARACLGFKNFPIS